MFALMNKPTSGPVFLLEEPIVISRRAARIFGSDVAAIAQQFVYWTLNPACRLSGVMRDGVKWVHFTLPQLEQEFNWLSLSTIRRGIATLEQCGFLLSKHPNPYAAKEFTVSQGMLLAIEGGKVDRINRETGLLEDSSSAENGRPSVQIELAVSSVQNEQTPSVQNEQTTTYTSTNTSSRQPSQAAGGKRQKAKGRDQLFDALCVETGVDLDSLTKAAASNVAGVKKRLLEAEPYLSPEMIRLKCFEYRRQFPRAALTVNALEKHWPSLNIGFRKQAQNPSQVRLSGPTIIQNPEPEDLSKAWEAAEAADGGAR